MYTYEATFNIFVAEKIFRVPYGIPMSLSVVENFLQIFLKQQLRQLKALHFMSFNKMKITFCIIVETFYDNAGDATEPAGLAEKNI